MVESDSGDDAANVNEKAVRSSTRNIRPTQEMVDSKEYERRRRMQFVSLMDVDSGEESEDESEDD